MKLSLLWSNLDTGLSSGTRDKRPLTPEDLAAGQRAFRVRLIDRDLDLHRSWESWWGRSHHVYSGLGVGCLPKPPVPSEGSRYSCVPRGTDRNARFSFSRINPFWWRNTWLSFVCGQHTDSLQQTLTAHRARGVHHSLPVSWTLPTAPHEGSSHNVCDTYFPQPSGLEVRPCQQVPELPCV